MRLNEKKLLKSYLNFMNYNNVHCRCNIVIEVHTFHFSFSIAVNPVSDVQSRQVVAGPPLLLSCDTGATLPPEQVQWFRDGIQLSHGSLSGVRKPEA